MKEAYKIAGGMARRAGEKARKYHNCKPTSAALIAGDRVLVRHLTERGGPGKLRSYWERQIHIVVRRLRRIPLCTKYAQSREAESGVYIETSCCSVMNFLLLIR